MANENDAGRDIWLTVSLVLAAVVIVLGACYFLWSWLATPPPAPSRIDLNGLSASSRKNSDETPEYRELLDKSNEQGAKAAAQQNTSFIGSIPFAQENVVPPVSAAKRATVPVQSTARQSRSDQGQANTNSSKQDEKRLDALNELLKRIKPAPEKVERPQGVQVAGVLGGSAGMDGGKGAGGGNYQQWSESLPGGRRLDVSTANATNGGPASLPAVEIVPPYWRGPGVIDIGVDSDNSITPVLASVKTGPYAGAQLKAPDGARLAGDGVVIHLTEMAWRGVNYKVDAYALHDETLLANVATDVNHRYMSRIVLPAILKGIGGVGEMYSQANTQVVTNGFNTQTVRPGLPDGGAVAGAIAGGAAGQAAKVLSDDAARTPATQATVIPGQVVAIQFMRGVYAGDAIVPGQGGESIKPSVSQQASRTPGDQPYSEDQWRTQAQARIESQRRLQEDNQ